MLLSFVIVSFVIQRIICPNNPDFITTNEQPPEKQNINFVDVEINEFPFLVLVFVVWLENNEEKCRSATMAVLFDENTILMNVDSTELLKEIKVSNKINYTNINRYNPVFSFFHPEVFVIYGKSDFREYYYQMDFDNFDDFRSIVCDCEKVKNDGVRLIRIVEHPIQFMIPSATYFLRNPIVCLGVLERSITQNGKNIMYVDLYKGEEVLKGDLTFIGWNPPIYNWDIIMEGYFYTNDVYLSSYHPSLYKFKKITFPYLGCEKCKYICNSFKMDYADDYYHPACYSEREDCVGYIDQYFNFTEVRIDRGKNNFGFILMKKYVHPRTKKIKWKYYGNPTSILTESYFYGDELRFYKIIFVKISHYVKWILKTTTSSKPGNKILFVFVIIILICVIIILFTISLLTIFFILKKKKKDRGTGGNKEVKSESSTTKEDQKVVDVMKTYIQVPEWTDEKENI